MLLLLFASRSHPFNLWHCSVPFAITMTMLSHRGGEALKRWLPHSSIAPALCIGLIALLLSNSAFLNYPSLLASPFRNEPGPRPSLMTDPLDLSGLPTEFGPLAASFQKIVSAIREVASDGEEIAIFDADDTLLYYAARVAPWSRYSSFYKMAVNYRSLDELRFQLAQRPPRFIVIRNQPAPAEYRFIWSPIHSIARSGYVLFRTVEDFEFWRRPDELPAQ